MQDLITVTRRISNLVEFIKEKTRANLVESHRNGSLKLDNEALVGVVDIVEKSINQGFQMGYGDVESLLSQLLSE